MRCLATSGRREADTELLRAAPQTGEAPAKLRHHRALVHHDSNASRPGRFRKPQRLGSRFQLLLVHCLTAHTRLRLRQLLRHVSLSSLLQLHGVRHAVCFEQEASLLCGNQPNRSGTHQNHWPACCTILGPRRTYASRSDRLKQFVRTWPTERGRTEVDQMERRGGPGMNYRQAKSIDMPDLVRIAQVLSLSTE